MFLCINTKKKKKGLEFDFKSYIIYDARFGGPPKRRLPEQENANVRTAQSQTREAEAFRL
jgi:hypothetical protein